MEGAPRRRGMQREFKTGWKAKFRRRRRSNSFKTLFNKISLTDSRRRPAWEGWGGGGEGGRRERVVEREGMGERVELEARGSCRRRVDKEREEWKREVEFFCFGFFSLSLLQVSLPRQRQNGRKNKTLPRWSLRNLERLCVQRRKTLKTKKEKREKKALRFYSPSPSPWPPPPPPPWPSLSQTTLALGFFASSLALKAARSVSDFGVQGPLLRSL